MHIANPIHSIATDAICLYEKLFVKINYALRRNRSQIFELNNLTSSCHLRLGRPDVKDQVDLLAERWSDQYALLTGPWQIWGRIARIHEHYIAAANQVLKSHNLSYTEFQTLAAVAAVGAPYRANPSQVTQYNLLTSGGTANVLSRLQAKGLITRIPDLVDRRSVQIELTEAGLKAFRNAVDDEKSVEHRLLSDLSTDESLSLITLLRKLAISSGA